MSEFHPVAAELTLSLEGSAVGSLANNLTTTVEGYALDARQGYILDKKKLDISHVVDNLNTETEGRALSARQGKYLNDTKVGHTELPSAVNKILNNSSLFILLSVEEFDTLTKGQKAELYASGVRLVATGSASYLLDENGMAHPLGLPVTGKAADSDKLAGKEPSYYLESGMQAELVYTNPSTSTGFSGLIELDLTDCDGVLLVTAWSTFILRIGSSETVTIFSGDWTGNTYKTLYTRSFSAGEDGVNVSPCYYVNVASLTNAAGSDNKLGYIEEIYKIKGLMAS